MPAPCQLCKAHWECTDEMSQTESSRSGHWEVGALVERLLGELLSASEHIFLMARCYTPIKSAIRGSMNHLMEHRAACSVQLMWPQKILVGR